jgi:hypothetical protein
MSSNTRIIDWRFQKIYSPEEENEKAAKALSLNSTTSEESIARQLTQNLKAASRIRKPTVIVDRLAYRLKAPAPSSRLKAASSKTTLQQQDDAKPNFPKREIQGANISRTQYERIKDASVQVAATVPTHDYQPMKESSSENKTTLVIKTSCLGCNAKATQVLHFKPGNEMRPSRNPQILPKLCQACKGDMYCEYSGSALNLNLYPFI